MKNRRKKKGRWLAKLEYDVQHYQPFDTCHPFHDLYKIKNLLHKDQWKALYGNKTLQDLIDDNVLYAKEWGNQSDSYFISFPALKMMSTNRIFESLVSDTFIWIYFIRHFFSFLLFAIK